MIGELWFSEFFQMQLQQFDRLFFFLCVCEQKYLWWLSTLASHSEGTRASFSAILCWHSTKIPSWQRQRGRFLLHDSLYRRERGAAAETWGSLSIKCSEISRLEIQRHRVYISSGLYTVVLQSANHWGEHVQSCRYRCGASSNIRMKNRSYLQDIHFLSPGPQTCRSGAADCTTTITNWFHQHELQWPQRDPPPPPCPRTWIR